MNLRKLEEVAFVWWEDYVPYGLCKPDDNPPSDKCRLAIIGKCYGRGWDEGKVILTRPIVSRDDKMAVDDMGTKYELGDYHSDYQQYLEARDQKISIIREWAFGVIGRSMHYELVERVGIYISGKVEGELFRMAVQKQEEAMLVFTNGKIGFFDPFSMTGGQEYALYGELYGKQRERYHSRPDIKGRYFCDYKGAFFPFVFENDMRYPKAGGAGVLRPESAKEYGVI